MNKFTEKSPADELQDEEYYDLIINFCSFVCLLKNKKMNFPSIFVEVIKNPVILHLYIDYCGFDDSREAMREFMKIDESIVRSKFLKKYINQNGE